MRTPSFRWWVGVRAGSRREAVAADDRGDERQGDERQDQPSVEMGAVHGVLLSRCWVVSGPSDGSEKLADRKDDDEQAEPECRGDKAGSGEHMPVIRRWEHGDSFVGIALCDPMTAASRELVSRRQVAAKPAHPPTPGDALYPR